MEGLMEFAEFLREFKEFAGVSTLVLSFLGFVLSFYLYFLVKYSKAEMAKKLGRVYKADGLKFLVTGLFGLAGYIDGPQWLWVIAYTARPFIMLYLIYALYSLVKHFVGLNSTKK